MGYIGQSRSERSAVAEMDENLKKFSELKAWQKRAVEAGVVRASEWHHTGKYYTRTNYYSLIDFEELDPKDFPKKEKEVKKDVFMACGFSVWGGTKKHPKIIGFETKIVKNPTKAQLNAKKYYMYEGFSEIFDTIEEAQDFLKGKQK